MLNTTDVIEEVRQGHICSSSCYPNTSKSATLQAILNKPNFECSYCSGKKLLPGFNSLKKSHPEFLQEWDYLNNILLAELDRMMAKSQAKVWWFCKNNPAYKYKASPQQRILFEKRFKEPCSIFKGLRRKREHFVPYKQIRS